MKRMLIGTLASVVVLAAVPAEAAVKRVNAAENAVRWDAEDVDDGEHFVLCDVFVLDFGDDPYVGLSCFGDDGFGEAWVRVKVPGVKGKVRRVRVAHTGDCSTLEVDWRKRRSKVLVTASVTAEADCELRTVRVRYRPR